MCFPFYKHLSGIIAELLALGAPHLRKFGKLSILKNFGYDVSARPSVHSLGGEGRESDVSPSEGGVCHSFMAGNCAMHLYNSHFSWREIAQDMAWPLSLRSKTCLLLFSTSS